MNTLSILRTEEELFLNYNVDQRTIEDNNRIEWADKNEEIWDTNNRKKFANTDDPTKLPDTFVLRDIMQAASREVKLWLLSYEGRAFMHSKYPAVSLNKIKSYCGVYTYVHGVVKETVGEDSAGRIKGDYSIRYFKRDNESQKAARKALEDLIERAEHIVEYKS
tara:strand:+ start:191 stop:682 length:492 start_codon:yes stop_codon:yes gene_type:complete